MGRQCSVCIHEKRDEIDDLIVEGISNREIGRRFGLGKDAINRHAAKHLPETLKLAHANSEGNRAEGLSARIEMLISSAEGLLKYGQDRTKAQAWAAGLRELRHCLELLARVSGELDERPVVNLIALPEWAELRSLILGALTDYPEAKAAILDALTSA